MYYKNATKVKSRWYFPPASVANHLRKYQVTRLLDTLRSLDSSELLRSRDSLLQ